MKHPKQSIAAVFFIGSLVVFSFVKIPRLFLHHVFVPVALADDNEREIGDRERDYQLPPTPVTPPAVVPSPTSSTPTPQTNTPSTPKPPKAPKTTAPVVQNVVTYKTVVTTTLVTDQGYDTDGDGDGLVDAIDPDPARPQSDYFTDTDSDGVPNAYDAHHDENDFAYLDTETDANQNGIVDSYE